MMLATQHDIFGKAITVHHDRPYIVGGLGDVATDSLAQQAALTVVMQQIAASQAGQQKSLEQMAFWTRTSGYVAVGTAVLSALIGVAVFVRRNP